MNDRDEDNNRLAEFETIYDDLRNKVAANLLAEAQFGAITLEQRLWLSRAFHKRFDWDINEKWVQHDAQVCRELLQLLQADSDVVSRLECTLGMPLIHFVAGCSAPFIFVVRQLLEAGESVDRLWQRDIAYVVAPLHCVQSMPMLHMLIVEAGANVNAPGASITPLAYMRTNGNLLMERALFVYGGKYDYGCKSEKGAKTDEIVRLNALYAACAFGGYSLRNLQRLLTPQTIATADLDRALWLFCWQQQAWQYGATLNLDCVRYLLAVGANAHVLDYDWLVPPLGSHNNAAPYNGTPNADVLFVIFVHQRLRQQCASLRQVQLVRRLVNNWPFEKSLHHLINRMQSPSPEWKEEAEVQQHMLAVSGLLEL